MKVLMLVNWKIKYCNAKPADKQPPDYFVEGEHYWFFRYFKDQPKVDVVDISSIPWLERFEKNKLRFYIWQTVKVLPRLHKYDLIISHGMQSGVVLSLWRRLFKTRAKHIVFDIGSFNSAAESGMALKLMQFASRSIDGLIYHTSSQLGYYQRFFPWLVSKSKFIRFGMDVELFDSLNSESIHEAYILSVGYAMRDWDTVIKAYQKINAEVKFRMIGYVDDKFRNIPGLEQMPPLPVNILNTQIRNALFCVHPLIDVNYSYGQMTLMQQMALGKCVIAAKVNSLVDYIDEDTAVFYEPQNVDDLAEKMERMLRDQNLRERIASNGQRYLQKYCNERIMAEEIEAFLEKCVES